MRQSFDRTIAFAPDAGGAAGGGAAAPGAGIAASGSAGAGTGAAPGGAASGAGGRFVDSLPEPIRGHEALRDVRDLGDLAGRYVAAATPKPLAETLPREIAGEAYFKDIKSVEDLAKKAFNQAKLIGRNPDTLLVLPGKDARPEEVEAFYARLGRPDKPEGYALTPPAGRDWSDGDRAFQAAMLPAAHKLGVSQAQMAGLAEAFNGYGATLAAATRARQDAAAEATAQALRGEWGNAYEERIGAANLALGHYAREAGVDLAALNGELDRTRLGNNPAMAKLLAHLGAQLREDGLIGRASPGGATPSPNEARQQISAFFADPARQKALNDKRHPGHQAALTEKARLYELAYPPGA